MVERVAAFLLLIKFAKRQLFPSKVRAGCVNPLAPTEPIPLNPLYQFIKIQDEQQQPQKENSQKLY